MAFSTRKPRGTSPSGLPCTLWVRPPLLNLQTSVLLRVSLYFASSGLVGGFYTADLFGGLRRAGGYLERAEVCTSHRPCFWLYLGFTAGHFAPLDLGTCAAIICN